MDEFWSGCVAQKQARRIVGSGMHAEGSARPRAACAEGGRGSKVGCERASRSGAACQQKWAQCLGCCSAVEVDD